MEDQYWPLSDGPDDEIDQIWPDLPSVAEVWSNVSVNIHATVVDFVEKMRAAAGYAKPRKSDYEMYLPGHGEGYNSDHAIPDEIFAMDLAGPSDEVTFSYAGHTFRGRLLGFDMTEDGIQRETIQLSNGRVMPIVKHNSGPQKDPFRKRGRFK